MPDEQHWTERVMDRLEKWWDRFWKIAGPAILAYLTAISTANHNRIEEVKGKQDQTADAAEERAAEVKQEVSKRADVIDKEAEKQRKATAANLYGTYRYLESQAVSPEEIKRAQEAKRLWEEFTNSGKK